jgi:hypothetical protein
MRLKATTKWKTRSGKYRRIRLYQAWQNLNGRVSGRLYAGNGARPWMGKPVDWLTWHEFRAWALANGYNGTQCSLDRIRKSLGYGPDNCRWVTREMNSWLQHHPIGPDPDYPDVPF